VIQSQSGLQCAYPAVDLTQTVPLATAKYIAQPTTKPVPSFQVFRNQPIILGPPTNSTYNTYVAPLYNDGMYSKGFIAI